jgi:hypothetical protein
MLKSMTLALGDGFTSFSDGFTGLSLANAWTKATWASQSPTVLPSELASISYDDDDAAATLDTLTIDTSSNYSVEALLAPWHGEWHGKYQLYLRMDNTTPAYATEGVEVELIQTGSTGAYTASLKSYIGSVETVVDTDSGTITAGAYPGWLTATVAADVVTVWWNGTQILTGTVDSHSGVKVGFGLEATVEDGLALCNVFRVQYYSTGTVEALRTQLIASAGGDLWKEGPYGVMTQVTSNLTVRDDAKLNSAQTAQKLYIADYGDLRDTGTDGTMSGAKLDDAGAQDWTTLGIDTDSDVCVLSAVGGGTTAGTYAITAVHATDGVTLSPDPGDGTCSYRIERGPKIYDPLTDTISLWIATSGKGSVPTGCPLIARYLDRICLGGADIAPHVWYMPRAGDPLDWDYSQTDAQAAVAGTTAEAGVPGDPLTAFVPFSDDYLVMGCMDSLWRMTGNPAQGGRLDNLSQTIGIIDQDAWCLGPNGELIFLSRNGLYQMVPGGNSYPQPISHETLPKEMKHVDTKVYEVNLEYDVADRGVHVYMTPDSPNGRVHYWYDWDNKTFWPVTLDGEHEPTVTTAYEGTAVEDSGVLLGCRDGKLRRFSHLAGNDCGTAFTSYVMIGPIPLASQGNVGRTIKMDGVLAAESGAITWSLHPGLTFEAAVNASASDSGDWEEGLNYATHPSSRGSAVCLKLTGTTGVRWAYESCDMVTKEAGMRRKQ